MVKNYQQVIASFEKRDSKIKGHFEYLPDLIKAFPWSVSVGYLFSRVEDAKRTTIYLGLAKCHNVDSIVAFNFVKDDYLSRKRFQQIFNIIFNEYIPTDLLKNLKQAENVRDSVAHGKVWDIADARKAIVDILDFAEGFNKLVQGLAGIQPFNNDLRGFKGRKKSLPSDTSGWVVKGISSAADEVKLKNDQF